MTEHTVVTSTQVTCSRVDDAGEREAAMVILFFVSLKKGLA